MVPANMYLIKWPTPPLLLTGTLCSERTYGVLRNNKCYWLRKTGSFWLLNIYPPSPFTLAQSLLHKPWTRWIWLLGEFKSTCTIYYLSLNLCLSSSEANVTTMVMMPFHTALGMDMLWFSTWMPMYAFLYTWVAIHPLHKNRRLHVRRLRRPLFSCNFLPLRSRRPCHSHRLQQSWHSTFRQRP